MTQNGQTRSVPGRTTPKSAPARRPVQPPARGPSSRVWAGLAVLVILAGVIAIVASRGGKDDTTTARTTGSTAQGSTGSTAVTHAETRPVRVTGSPLPRYDGEPDPAVGTSVPRVEGAGFDGTPVTIAPDGRAELILFVAHWCPHCQREVPRLTTYLRDHPLPAGIDLITVATGTTPDRPNYPPSEWLAREKWPGKTVLADSTDSRAAGALGLSAYPFFVAVDKDGKVVARTSGELTTDQFAELVQLAQGA
jgi:cytochrome c biogenesis protein CcmG/thiol:disulfide interchange protein DsbE